MLDDLTDIVLVVKCYMYGDGVRTDNFVFRMSTKHTSFVFFMCFLVNIFCICFSTTISCISDKEVENVIESYCWIKAMYTLPTEPDKDLAIHEGVRQQDPSDQIIVHHFYQFVYTLLFLQCGLVLLPKILWTGLENGRMKDYKHFLDKISPLKSELDDLQKEMDDPKLSNQDELDGIYPNLESFNLIPNPESTNLIPNHETRNETTKRHGGKVVKNENKTKVEKRLKSKKDKNRAKLAEYLYEHFHLYNFYAYRFVLCELLALANIIGNIFIMNFYLGSTYLTYGRDLLGRYSFLEESLINRFPAVSYFSRSNPITSRIFPKVTKCSMNVVGPSGNLVPYDALCVLPINMVNEMIYFFLWWWLACILCISAIGIIYRLMFMLSARLRVEVLKRLMKLEKMKDRTPHFRLHFKLLMQKIKFADWFVLCMVKKNTDIITFTELIIEMTDQDVEACGEKKKALKRQESHSYSPRRNFNSIPTREQHIDTVDYPHRNEASSSKALHYSRPRGTVHQKESEMEPHECVALINLGSNISMSSIV